MAGDKLGRFAVGRPYLVHGLGPIDAYLAHDMWVRGERCAVVDVILLMPALLRLPIGLRRGSRLAQNRRVRWIVLLPRSARAAHGEHSGLRGIDRWIRREFRRVHVERRLKRCTRRRRRRGRCVAKYRLDGGLRSDQSGVRRVLRRRPGGPPPPPSPPC